MSVIFRITTVSISLEKLLSGQIQYMESKGLKMITASNGDYNSTEHYNISNLRRAINPLRDTLALVQLYRVIRKRKPDIVHTHTPKAGLLGMCAAWAAGVPVRMHTVAGLPLMQKTGIYQKILIYMEKLTYFFSTSVHPNSHGLMGFINKRISTDSKISVIGKGTSNGINLEYFSPKYTSDEQCEEIRRRLDLYNKQVFFFIGRIVKDKGIIETVKAFAEIYKKNQNIKLVLLGSYEQELNPVPNAILTFINSHPGIISLGYIQDVRPYIKVSDILVFPSYREGFPNVPMQFAAFKKALILSDINGCNELVEDKKSGLLVPIKNVKALYEAMDYMLKNIDFRIQSGERVYNFIWENFQQSEIWDLIHKKYDELLRKSNV